MESSIYTDPSGFDSSEGMAGETTGLAEDSDREYKEKCRSSRLPIWMFLFLSSLVTLGSAMEAADGTFDTKSVADRKWAVACSTITFIITSIVLLLLLSPVFSVFMAGTKLEGCIIFTAAIFWSSVVSVSTTPITGLAIDEMGAISYGNLYYFSWSSFLCTLMLAVSYIKSFYFIDIEAEMEARGARIAQWTYLFLFGMLMTGASSAIHDNICASYANPTIPPTPSYCRRTTLSLVLSIGACCISVLIIGIKLALSSYSRNYFMFEAYLSLILFIGFAFGIAFITSRNGPGGPIGNLYYTTWGSVVSITLIGCSCFAEYQNLKLSSSSYGAAGDFLPQYDAGTYDPQSTINTPSLYGDNTAPSLYGDNTPSMYGDNTPSMYGDASVEFV